MRKKIIDIVKMLKIKLILNHNTICRRPDSFFFSFKLSNEEKRKVQHCGAIEIFPQTHRVTTSLVLCDFLSLFSHDNICGK